MKCGETATPIGGVLAALLQVALFGKQLAVSFGGTAFQNGNQNRGASVQTVKRCLEHLTGLIPGVSDRAGLIEFRIQIPRDHNSGAIYGKPRSYLLPLERIHYDDEIRRGHHGGNERSRAEAR